MLEIEWFLCPIYYFLFVYIFINEYLLCFWEKFNKILQKYVLDGLPLIFRTQEKETILSATGAKAQNQHMNNSIYRRMQNEAGWHWMGLQRKVLTDTFYILLSLWQVISGGKNNCINSYHYRTRNALEPREGWKHPLASLFQHCRALPTRCPTIFFDLTACCGLNMRVSSKSVCWKL